MNYVYWTITSFSTVEFGDVHPMTRRFFFYMFFVH